MVDVGPGISLWNLLKTGAEARNESHEDALWRGSHAPSSRADARTRQIDARMPIARYFSLR